MGIRPEFKLRLPSVVATGHSLLADLILTFTEPTQVDVIGVDIRGETRIAMHEYRALVDRFFARAWQSATGVVAREHRVKAVFDIPEDAPPTYDGANAVVVYEVTVRVTVHGMKGPVERAYRLVVERAAAPPPPPQPVLLVTSRKGPIGDTPFMELALDTTHVAIGDVLVGSISIQNLRDRRVRGVDVVLMEREIITAPRRDKLRGKRFRWRVLDGSPKEGEAIPFRIAVPSQATPSFRAGALEVHSYVEARVDVAWSDDVVVGAPVIIAPRATKRREASGKIAQIGSERQLVNWQRAAAQTGFVVDPDGQRLHGRRGCVVLEISAESRDDGPWIVAKLGWPKLGLDLDVRERRLRDALAVDLIKSGDARIDARLFARARDRHQVKDVITPALLGPMMFFEDVAVDDSGAVLASRGAPHALTLLVQLIEAALVVADVFDLLSRETPPPPLFTNDEVAAWRALSDRLHGRLERGRMWIHGARVGTDTVAIGVRWSDAGVCLGAVVSVLIDPPLEAPPASPEDPAISPAARALWSELVVAARGPLRVEANGIAIDLGDRLADPETAMPIVELMVALRRSLSGPRAAGPFR